jgi:hypothetical protein
MQASESPRAMADMKAMRQTADGRTSRSKKLPDWANDELQDGERNGR